MSKFLRMLPISAMAGLAVVTALSSCSGTSDRLPPAGSVVPSNPEADELWHEAQAAETRGKNGKAIKIYDDLVKKYPYADHAPQAQFRHATLLDSDGEVLKAFDSYQVFIERYQNSDLYAQALSRQALVAHAAADGAIKSNFLGIKSRLSGEQIALMLTKVRQNAPQAKSAPKAQYTIGQVWENREKEEKAILAYQLILDDYPGSIYGPDAQYRIGVIYLEQTKRGNQNQATLNQARYAFEDLIQTYPDSKLAKPAKGHLSEIATQDITRNYDIAEFYLKKKDYTSAIFYYKEVLRKVDSGPLHDQATRRLAELQGA